MSCQRSIVLSREELVKLKQNDEFDLLKIRPKSPAMCEDDRLISAFQEINDFIRQCGYVPRLSLNGQDTNEFSLRSRLEGIRNDIDKIKRLQEYDVFRLLSEAKAIETIEDILCNDDLGLLNNDPDGIFNICHIPKESILPDHIAQRIPCKDFDNFENLFYQCHTDLVTEKRSLRPFAMEQQINAGEFYVLRGVLTYVASVGKKENVNGKTNARLRCIFENGTESDMLLRSLARALYKNGRRVTEHMDKLMDGLCNIKTNEDLETGYIYVLKSLSDASKIKEITNLYKIGFSRICAKERIKNAKNDPTFLLAPVHLIAEYKCYNFKPQKLEVSLHTFLRGACLDMEISDVNGHRHIPREWFVVPLHVINEAIEMLISGEINNYRYDLQKQKIMCKE